MQMIALSYAFSDSIDDIINMLESHSRTLIEWYENSYLKPNTDKWHLILIAAGDDMKIIIGNKCIYNSDCEKMLGVHFDNNLLWTLTLLNGRAKATCSF